MRSLPTRTRPLVAATAVAALGLAAGLVASSRAAGTAATTTTGATTTATTTTSGTPPRNTGLPAISGTAQEGAMLSASTGSWVSSDPVTFTYQWRRCDTKGASCSDIGGATDKSHVLESVDVGTTLRVDVTAHSTGGTTAAESPQSATIAATPTPPATGCPSVKPGQVVDVSQISSPARLQISAFQPSPSRLPRSLQQFTLRVVVGDTCGHPVKGALVYATAIPFEQVSIPSEQATGGDGSITLTFVRAARFPASARQQLLAVFVRARQPGKDVLAGISTRRLVSIPVGSR